MNERRIQRLQEQIKARVAEILLREIADPEIGLVTISRVEVDREFTTCKVFWSVIGDQTKKAHTERALRRARGYVQREVGTTLHTRTVPRLDWVFDESIAGAVRMQELLSELRHERESRGGGGEEAGGEPTGDAGERGQDGGPDADEREAAGPADEAGDDGESDGDGPRAV